MQEGSTPDKNIKCSFSKYLDKLTVGVFAKFKLSWQIYLIFLILLPNLANLPNSVKIKNPLNISYNFSFWNTWNLHWEHFELSLRFFVQNLKHLARFGRIAYFDKFISEKKLNYSLCILFVLPPRKWTLRKTRQAWCITQTSE